MKLVKTTLWSGLISFMRIASGFVSTKVVAVLIGPAGVATVGAFINFVAIVLTFGNGAINNGVVKYTAEFKESDLKPLFATSLKISIYCSVFFGAIIILFANLIGKTLFETSAYVNTIRFLGLCLIFYSLNSLLLSILNGLGKISLFTLINTISTLCGLVLTCFLSYYFRVEGALYAVVLSQTIVFFIAVALIIKNKILNYGDFKHEFSRQILTKLSHYSLMAVITALTVPVSQIIIRNFIITNLGIDMAGIWQGMARISDGYLMVVNTALSTYYLPKLSSLNKDVEIRSELFKGAKIIIPVTMVLCGVIYVCRELIVTILYTKEFQSMQKLFLWQVLGDFFKIASFLLAFLLLAKARVKEFIILEIGATLCSIGLNYIFITRYGIEGSSFAFFINYVIYFLALVFVFKNLLFKKL
ncbi:O-antigen translocase [Sphingobacterium sp.]|uniref:O-antigen translocase n=1 Tax=Sphingobacterium sp. TaxID=341027 RepID=UPI0028A04A42|nr:O-antigen translocase [Sphingobacterium sp.]